MAIAPQLDALLKKMGQDDLADLSSALVPALVEEVESLTGAGVSSTEAMVLAAIQPVLQAAVASLIGKVKL